MSDQPTQPAAPTTPVQDTTQPTPEPTLEQELDQVAQNTKQLIQTDAAAAQSLASTSAMQDIVIDVEKELLDEIMKRLEDNQLSPEQAQSLAKEFLSYLPIQDQKDLLDKLYKMSQENKEFQGIYLKYAQPVRENERLEKLKLMSEHIQKGNIEEALAVAKGGTQ